MKLVKGGTQLKQLTPRIKPTNPPIFFLLTHVVMKLLFICKKFLFEEDSLVIFGILTTYNIYFPATAYFGMSPAPFPLLLAPISQLNRYKGYSFTGCGAHVDYHLNQLSGAGYEITWCYVSLCIVICLPSI